MQIVVNLTFKVFIRVYSCPFAVAREIRRVPQQFDRLLLDGLTRSSRFGDQLPDGKVERALLEV